MVNGKTQFHIAWDFIKEYPSVDTSVWMHDLYHADFTPYDQEELDILKKCNEDKNIWKLVTRRNKKIDEKKEI